MARRGRGRLSAIEKLPKEATPIVAWANEQLRDRERDQTDIYPEFVARLEELDRKHRGELAIAVPSFSAFNRHSIKLAALARRMNEMLAISGALAKRFDPKSADDLTIIASEAIKTLVFEIVTAKGEAGIDPKGALELAGALFKANQASKVSAERRAKVEKEFAEQVNEAVDTAAKAKGLTKETAEDIKTLILGVKAQT